MTEFHLPPEWARQSAVMLTWPHDQTDWADRLAQVEPLYALISYHIARFETVLIICRDSAHQQHIQSLLAQHTPPVPGERLRFAIAASNDTWARDHGPITVLHQDGETVQPRLLDFRFNGWGGKHPAALDNAITGTAHSQGAFGQTPLQTLPLVLEGGSIEVDGDGTLLTTAHCLLAPTRNPALSAAQIEQQLKQLLGVTRVLWLQHGELQGDDTDAHIDTLVRFSDAHTLLYMQCEDPQDEHYQPLQAMQEELRALRQRNGQPYRLIPLPLPAAVYDEHGQRLPASYVNFLIINGAVLAPLYNDPLDALVMQRLAEAFPQHEIIGLDCSPLIQQYGSLHCITMQLPAQVML